MTVNYYYFIFLYKINIWVIQLLSIKEKLIKMSMVPESVGEVVLIKEFDKKDGYRYSILYIAVGIFNAMKEKSDASNEDVMTCHYSLPNGEEGHIRLPIYDEFIANPLCGIVKIEDPSKVDALMNKHFPDALAKKQMAEEKMKIRDFIFAFIETFNVKKTHHHVVKSFRQMGSVMEHPGFTTLLSYAVQDSNKFKVIVKYGVHDIKVIKLIPLRST